MGFGEVNCSLPTDADHTSSRERCLSLEDALAVHREIVELFERARVAIKASELLLIGSAALHVREVLVRPTNDIDFLLSHVSTGELKKTLWPLIERGIVHQRAEHVFGLSSVTGLECDLISPHDRGIRASIVPALFERAQKFDSLHCTAPEDVLTLKLAALADRLLRGRPTDRIEKYQRDILGLVVHRHVKIDVHRMDVLLRAYDPAVYDAARRIFSEVTSLKTSVFQT